MRYLSCILLLGALACGDGKFHEDPSAYVCLDGFTYLYLPMSGYPTLVPSGDHTLVPIFVMDKKLGFGVPKPCSVPEE